MFHESFFVQEPESHFGKMLFKLLEYIVSLLRFVWELLKEPFKSHACHNCECNEYSDEAFFMWMQERSKFASYAEEMLSANIVGRPLKCSRCECPREKHGTLKKKLLTCDYMPDGGRVYVEQNRRETIERRERRFENKLGDGLRERRPGVEVDVVKQGEGVSIKSGDVVVCHYDAYVKSTMERFETSRDGQAFRFTAGNGEMVPGWEMGLKSAKKAERRKITVPPELAYRGREICGERNVTIVFDVEILSVEHI